jgi:hypothetical protein
MIKTAATLLLSALSLANACAAPTEAKATITVLGMPVLVAKASVGSPATGPWSGRPITLSIEPLRSLDAGQVASEAARRMVAEAGLPQAKADSFQAEMAKAATFEPGSSLADSCGSSPSLTLIVRGSKLEMGDVEVAEAFCSIWLSPSGNKDLRDGLGLP